MLGKSIILLNKLFLKHQVFTLKPNIQEITNELIEDSMEKYLCNKFVIGLGQWSAGWPEGKPTLFINWEKEITNVFERLQNLSNKHKKNKLQIFVRSTHYNPFGDVILQCPPKHWRNPIVIDGYNAISQKISQKFQMIPFIDTNFIISPMWDSAPDWCHYKNKAGQHDALYILYFILNFKPAQLKQQRLTLF